MIASPTAILRAEHDLILRALALLERLADRLGRGEPTDEAARQWLLDFFATFVNGCHYWKEEQHLFPALEHRGIPRPGELLDSMLADHNEGRRLARALSDGPCYVQSDLVRRYAALLRSHIQRENDVLFPVADEVLDRERQGQLAAEFGAVEAQIVGPGVREGLLADLVRLEGDAGPPARSAPTSPIALLRDEHEVIIQALTVLERLGALLDRARPPDRQALRWLVDFCRTFVDGSHHAKEEQYLFPALEHQGIEREGGPLGAMLEEHEASRRLLAAMDSDDPAAVATAIARYTTLVRVHIEKENGILFRLADMMLPVDEQHRLAQAFEAAGLDVGSDGRRRLVEELNRLDAALSGA